MKKKSKNQKTQYERIGIFSIEEVLPFIIFSDRKSKETDKIYNNHRVSMISMRYKVFATYGIRCICCGIEGKYFALEKSIYDKTGKRFHFNLYGIDKDGKEVMMTKDHLIPKCQGGQEILSNFRPMCEDCNTFKNDMKM